ncbi:hypothetical protein D3C86_1845510 [compost metagenome]
MQLFFRIHRYAVHFKDNFPCLNSKLFRRAAWQHSKHLKSSLWMNKEWASVLLLEPAVPHEQLMEHESSNRSNNGQRTPPTCQQRKPEQHDAVYKQAA